jgi:hypothetical protein
MPYSDTRFCVQLAEGKTTYTIVTDDMERLSSVASACRRLRDLACMRMNFTLLPFLRFFIDQRRIQTMQKFTSGWSHTHSIHLRGYLVRYVRHSLRIKRNRPGGFVVNPPRDLRHACQPVHSSLSPGCAGQPVNDTADYVVIRDDWLWARSLSLATVQNASEKTQLRHVSDPR